MNLSRINENDWGKIIDNPQFASPIAGDGSNRTYKRIRLEEAGPTYILMELQGKDREFLQKEQYDWPIIAKTLAQKNIRCPRLHLVLKKYACLLIEDCGSTTLHQFLLKQRYPSSKSIEYQQAAQIISKFLSFDYNSQDLWCQRQFDYHLLSHELHFFQKHLFQSYPNLSKVIDKSSLDKDINNLSQHLSKHSTYFTHRDFHSKNLMIKENELIVIDFQDARLGSAAYDLVSLCFDAYVPMPSEERLSLLDQCLQAIAKNSSATKVVKEIEQSWKNVLLQRQLKALGSFCFLSKEKQDPFYKNSILPALQTLMDVSPYNPKWPYLSKDLLVQLKDGVTHAL